MKRRNFLSILGIAATSGCLRTEINQASDQTPSSNQAPNQTSPSSQTPTSDPNRKSTTVSNRSSTESERSEVTDSPDEEELSLDGTWHTYQSDYQNTGFRDVGSDSIEGLAEVWEFQTDNNIEESSPAVVNQTVVVADQTTLFAVNAQTGEQRWRYSTDDANGGWSPTVSGDTVYIATPQATVHAIILENGNQRWTSELDGSASDFLSISDTTIYVGGSNMQALNAETGQQEWSFSTSGWPTSPAIYDETVYFGTDEGVLYAVSTDGSQEWQFEGENSIYSPPTVTEERVYIGSGSTLHAVSRENGTPEWRFDTYSTIRSSVAVGEDRIILGNNRTYALSVDDGAEEWVTEWSLDQASPVVTPGYVYIACEDGYFRVLDKQTGDSQASVWLGEDLDTTPAVVGDMVFIGAPDGRLAALGVQ